MEEPDIQQQIVERAYDLAIDPERFVDFFEIWDKHLVSNVVSEDIRCDLEQSKRYGSHFFRASIFLDQWQDRSQIAETSLLSGFESVSAFAINSQFRIIDVNETAAEQFAVAPGDLLQALPISQDDIDILKNQITARWQRGDQTAAIYQFYVPKLRRNIVVQFRAICSSEAGKFAVVATSELGWPSKLNDVLASSFSLSKAEISVLRGIVECKSLKEIAEQRGRSLATVRTQLRTILSKTDMHTQAELVRMVLGLIEVVSDVETGAKRHAGVAHQGGQLRPCVVRTINRPDNRTLDYYLLGDPDGQPVLYFPLDLGFTRWPMSAEREATERGYKIIVPIRPGFGNSTRLKENANVTQEICLDIAAVLDAERVDACPAISFGSDSYFAFSFIQEFPSRLTALIACAGVLPMNKPEQYERMDSWFRYSMINAKFAPRMVPFLMKAGFFLAQRVGKDRFLKLLFSECPADIATYEIPEVLDAIKLGSEVALTESFTAHEAFSREILEEAGKDWTHVVQAAQNVVPIHFLSGTDDPLVRKNTLDEFEEQFDWIDFRRIPNAGKLLFFKHWADVFVLMDNYLPQK